MLMLRIDDEPFLNLIKKWLKAGILDTDGKVLHPITGTPQGGIVSPILANVYLHYALDVWFEEVVKKHCEGNTITGDMPMILSVHFNTQVMRNAFIKRCRRDWQHWIGSSG